MPQELRKLVFSEDEVRAAVVDYCLRTKVPLPAANIEELVIGSSDEESLVTLKYSPDNPADPDTVSLNRDQVAAALIRFCMESNIPLPRQGQKVIQAQDGGIALMINVKRT